MPIDPRYQADFCSGSIYHVFNRTNNNERLFPSDENRYFFLKKYHDYLSPVAETFCWCLLPNHFHLLLRIKPEDAIIQYLSQSKNETTLTERQFLNGETGLSELVERSFKNMFQSYSLSFNKRHSRKGNLFYKPFKRVLIDKESQFTQIIIYIHANPIKHSVAKSFKSYNWSSYKTLLSDAPTKLLRHEVIDWFGNTEIFEKNHLDLVKYYYDCEGAIES
jgi:putative transposase